MIGDLIFILIFIFELFWSIFWGVKLSSELINDGFKETIVSYTREWKKFNILGKFCFLILCVLSIPGTILAGILFIIISIIDFIVTNRKNIFYKKEE